MAVKQIDAWAALWAIPIIVSHIEPEDLTPAHQKELVKISEKLLALSCLSDKK